MAVIKKLESRDLEATSFTDKGKVSKGRLSLTVSKGSTLLNHSVYEILAKTHSLKNHTKKHLTDLWKLILKQREARLLLPGFALELLMSKSFRQCIVEHEASETEPSNLDWEKWGVVWGGGSHPDVSKRNIKLCDLGKSPEPPPKFHLALNVLYRGVGRT